MRWDEQKVENDLRLPGVGDGATVRTFDAPEAMGINFHEVRARSALNHVPGGRFGFSWTINPYRGCTHACVFCFARRTHTYLDLDAGRDFEREIVVKVNLPELLRRELRRPSWRRELVALGTNTDPYQWVESRYRMMPEILTALEQARTPVSVLTKSPLALRDVEQFERMARGGLRVSVNLSVPTLDEDAWRATEPHTPSPAARLDAVAQLRRRGIESGVLVAPLMPGINDSPEQVEPILERARQADATFLGGVALHLREEVKDVFFAWLQSKRPDLLPRYEALYRDRAYMKPAQRQHATRALRPWGANRSAIDSSATTDEGPAASRPERTASRTAQARKPSRTARSRRQSRTARPKPATPRAGGAGALSGEDDVAVGDSGGGSENGRLAPARRTLPPRQAPPPQGSLF
jgi:DNA repair photolyase